MRETKFDFVIKSPRWLRAQCPKPCREPELGTMCANEVENCETVLLVVESKAASELLQVNRQALRWAEEEQGVDLGQVDALIVKVNDEDEIHVASTKLVPRR